MEKLTSTLNVAMSFIYILEMNELKRVGDEVWLSIDRKGRLGIGFYSAPPLNSALEKSYV